MTNQRFGCCLKKKILFWIRTRDLHFSSSFAPDKKGSSCRLLFRCSFSSFLSKAEKNGEILVLGSFFSLGYCRLRFLLLRTFFLIFAFCFLKFFFANFFLLIFFWLGFEDDFEKQFEADMKFKEEVAAKVEEILFDEYDDEEFVSSKGNFMFHYPLFIQKKESFEFKKKLTFFLSRRPQYQETTTTKTTTTTTTTTATTTTTTTAATTTKSSTTH